MSHGNPARQTNFGPPPTASSAWRGCAPAGAGPAGLHRPPELAGLDPALRLTPHAHDPSPATNQYPAGDPAGSARVEVWKDGGEEGAREGVQNERRKDQERGGLGP